MTLERVPNTGDRKDSSGGSGGSGPTAYDGKSSVLSLQVQQLERTIGLKDLAMADLEQKVSELEVSTYDGVFIWKISDFARKRQEAVAGRTPAIFSPGAIVLLPSPSEAPEWVPAGAGLLLNWHHECLHLTLTGS